jgi:hypothetical protein
VQTAYVNRDLIVDAPATRLSGRVPIARVFFACVALLTVLPLIGLPVMFELTHVAFGAPAGLLLAILAITGSMHVGATAFFYFDREFRSLIRLNRARFLWSIALLPAVLLVLGVSGAALVGPWALFALFALQGAWLFYHYQRQNYGLVSLVSANAGTGPLPRDIGLVLNMVVLAGFLGVIAVPGLFPVHLDRMVSSRVHAGLQWSGVGLYVVSFGFLLRAFVRHPTLRRDPWLSGGIVLAWAFFLPAVLFNAMAFLPLAVAHGAQYVYMMTILSGHSNRRWLGTVAMCALGAGIGLTLDSMKEFPAILAMIGIVQVHFLVDAKVWRLREPQQRVILKQRFAFLLARSGGAAPSDGTSPPERAG